jgi:Restriction endonuclease fold toxin 3
VRIDRSDPLDGPGDVQVGRPARSAADHLDAAGKDISAAMDHDGPPDPPRVVPDSTLQTERTMAYRAVVDAAYRQHATDRSDTRAETPERETETSVVSRTDVEDVERCEVVAAASGGDGSIGNGGGAQPPSGDTVPDPEDEDPEGVNGGLGELVTVNAKDRAADLLAERIDGKASVRFANGPANEFDAVSNDYVAQAKPANFTLNQAFRNQAKTTFEVALQSGRTPYFQFDGPPGPRVLHTLGRYADRYGIEPAIDVTPLGEANA